MLTNRSIDWKSMILGIAFTFSIAIIGYLFALIPNLNRIGPLAIAIILAIIYRQIWGYPIKLKSGITFSSTYFLRFAIVLYGLKLNMDVILADGIGLLIKSAFVIALAVILMFVFSKWWKLNTSLTFLLGVGTGICGAAAIAAVAPIIKAKAEDTAISIAIIALTGTVFSIGYTLLLPVLPLDTFSYSAWSGLSLHELAHVALAADPAGEDGLAFALLAKLSRVFLLVPFCFLLLLYMKVRTKTKDSAATISFPYFLIGFVLMSVLGTYVLGPVIPFSEQAINLTSEITTFLLTSAMVGLGLNVSVKAIREKALFPFLAMVIVSVVLSITVYFIV